MPLPTIDADFLQRTKERMAQTAQNDGGARGWASDNDVLVGDVVATCQTLANEAAEQDHGLTTMLMVAFQIGYEVRRAQTGDAG